MLDKLAASRELVLRTVPPPLGSDEPPRYEIFHDVMVPAVIDWRRRYVAEQALALERNQAAEEVRKAHERFRRYAFIFAAIAAILVMATVIFSLGLHSRNVEQQNLLAQSEAKLNSDPAASLKAALQAWDKRTTPEAEAAVRTALEADTQRLVIHADRGYFTSSEFLPDGRSLLTAGTDGTATLFNATTGQLIRTFQPRGTESPPALRQASVSGDGTMVLTTAVNLTVGVYDLNTGQNLGILPRVSGAAWGTISGQPVVLTFGGSAASLWDPHGLRKIKEYGDHTLEAALSPDGRHVLTVDYAKGKVALTVWDAASGRRVQTSAPVGFFASEAAICHCRLG